MANLFKPGAATSLLERLDKLHPDSKPLWGKMSVSQMVAHCKEPIKVALGETSLKHSLIGILFGKIAKKQLMKEGPFKRNLPTAPSFIVKDDRNFESEKQELESLIQRFASADANIIAARTHPFFGKMTPEEWGILQWKHMDHHLTQFGV